MPIFPPVTTEPETDALTREQLLPAAKVLCGELGLGGLEVTAFADGSLPVYAVGDKLVLKLYPPIYRHELDIESSVLRAVHGRLPIPTPGVERAGGFEGWGYVVMERLAGETLKEVWPRLSTEDKQRLAPQLGAVMAALHAIEDPALDVLGPGDWAGFVAKQKAVAVERHRRLRLDEVWVAQIPEFLDSVDFGEPEPVLLHTEFGREHLMMVQDDDGWRVSGLFDFEPALRGAAEYEWVGVGMFVSGGDADFLRRMLLGYGYVPEQLDEALSRRFLAYALLHVYSNFRWYLAILPPPAEPTFDSLAKAWWGTSVTQALTTSEGSGDSVSRPAGSG
ncbi:aminoglycoside 3'-phosphotransferase/choline kinase family protein [Amycolatopsis sp.]|jgi:hygromycin-B 7''-O-kinase|uniref:phosphotransferase family protein n=1 Tax=Amycolatopsis sp. TaxID=37632 RepID=UPI002E0CC548|nr:aminoglycoside 3'-phosphotransferase/choline kinase family protein [Amycolatopsis sp.]